MRSVTVFRFKVYDIQSDSYIESRRWGTIDGIKAIGGMVLDQAGKEIDSSLLVLDGQFTDRNSLLDARGGFQTEVKP